MSERATPETDHEELIDNGDTKPLLEFARKLESERDEARELARELRDALEDALSLPSDWAWFDNGRKALTKADTILP